MSKYTTDRATQIAYLQSKGWTVYRLKNSPIVIATHPLQNSAKGWHGKANLPAFYHTFRTAENRLEFVTGWVRKVSGSYEYRAAQKAEESQKRAAMKASDHYAIGDVLYNSWGYDQTNVDWYQVVEVKAKSIVIRSIAGNSNDHGQAGGGKTAPVRNVFKGPAMTKPLGASGDVASRHGSMSKWKGNAVYCSSDR